MSNETLQTICQIVVAIGIIFTALGGFGTYFFGQRIENDKSAKQTYVEKLESSSKLLLSGSKHYYPKLEFGDSGAILMYTDPQGTPLFKIAEDNELIIESEDGQVKVSIIIRDKAGNVVAEIIENEWKVIPPPNTWDRNYSKNALEVKDATGDIILQVKLVEDRIQFQAKSYDSHGKGIAFGKILGPEGWGGSIEMTGKNHPELLLTIQPIFKYPSDLHLGELADDNGT